MRRRVHSKAQGGHLDIVMLLWVKAQSCIPATSEFFTVIYGLFLTRSYLYTPMKAGQ